MVSFKVKPYFLINKIQNYSWGTRNEQAFIPRLLNMPVERDKPYAELWMGTHPNAPSEVEVEDRTIPLNAFIKQFPQQILGRKVVERFGPQLPFLFKVLSAAEALSIQAHPNKRQAEALHRKDPEHYPDDNHKPEIAVALDELSALVGFRSLNEISAVLQRFPEMAEFAGQTERAFDLEPDGQQKFRQFFQTLMLKSRTDVTGLEQTLSSIEQKILQKDERAERDALFLELRKKYGSDVGLLSIYLLNLLHLKKGQGVFLKAGVPHAYLKGNIVECMANSDNVVRAGLTPKFKDVQTLIDILTYETGAVEIYQGDAKAEFTYEPPVEEFAIKRLFLKRDQSTEFSPRTVHIMMVVNGQGRMMYDGKTVPIRKGQSILIPAEIGFIKLVSDPALEVFSAFVP